MKIKELLEAMEHYYYVGNCVNSFDKRGECIIPALPWSTVSDFAVSEESDFKTISPEKFKSHVMIPEDMMISLKGHDLVYFYDDHSDMYILHDETKDVHYFFVK